MIYVSRPLPLFSTLAMGLLDALHFIVVAGIVL